MLILCRKVNMVSFSPPRNTAPLLWGPTLAKGRATVLELTSINDQCYRDIDFVSLALSFSGTLSRQWCFVKPQTILKFH